MTEQKMIDKIKNGEFLDLVKTDDMFTYGRKVKNQVSNILSIEYDENDKIWYINTIKGRLFTKSEEEYNEILTKLNNYEALKLYITNDSEVRTKYLDLFMKKSETITSANSRKLTAIHTKAIETLEANYEAKTNALINSFEDKFTKVYDTIKENNKTFVKTIKKLDKTIKDVGKVNNQKLESQMEALTKIIDSFKSIMD